MSLIERKLERAEEEADAIWKSVYQPEESETETKTPPEVAEAKTEETPEEEAPETAVEEAAAVAPEAPSAKPDESDKTDWKQKYQTLDGKYKAEVPRLSAEVGQWREYATSLSRRISELEEVPRVVPKKDEPETDPDLEALAERDPDFATVIKKIKEDHGREIAALRKEMETGITADLKSVKEDLKLSKEERFDLALRTSGVPDWKEIDHDPAFLEWLRAPVPYTRATKLDFLKDAARNFDAVTASQFFLDFKASQNTEGTPEVVEEIPDPLNKFVAPPRSGGPSIPKRSVQPGLTKAQYEKFMNPRYQFNPADYGGRTEKQMEALFDAAILKGALI
jgi:hypothetical protein